MFIQVHSMESGYNIFLSFANTVRSHLVTHAKGKDDHLTMVIRLNNITVHVVKCWMENFSPIG